MKGFTLLEILVSVLILGLLVCGIYTVMNVGNLIYSEDINLLGLQQQVRQGMDRMVNEIRESKPSEISIVEANTKIIFKIPPEVYGDPWIGSISYYRDVNDANNDAVIDQIIREYPSGTRKILANDITSLSFSIAGDVVEIALAAKKSAGTRQLCFPAPCEEPPRTFKEIVKLRNENE